MGLELKGGNGAGNNPADKEWEQTSRETDNPWDIPGKQNDDLYIQEPLELRNTAMAELQAKNKESSPVVDFLVKTLIILVVFGLIIFVGKKIVSVVKPAGEDITAMLQNEESKIASDLELTFTTQPACAGSVYQYSEGMVSVKGNDDIGVVYIDGKQVGVHITSEKYTIFGTQIGDGEKHMYNNTQYPFDSFIMIVDEINSGKSTLYIYYNQQRNDCIFFIINNTTNRIQAMTYYSDFKKVTERLDTF